jgi:PAS domain S-box-containing protein
LKEKLKPQLKQIVDKLPLEKFIPTAFLIFLLLFVILTIIIYNSINSYRENITQVNSTHDVLNSIDDISLSLTQMQLDRRGYIVKFDSKYLADYYENKNHIKEEFTTLKGLVKSNPSQSLLVAALDSLAFASILFLDSSIAHFEANKKSIPEVQTTLVMESQERLDKLFLTAKDLKDEEISLLNQRQENANKNLGDTQLFIIAGSLFVFIVLGFSLFISTGLIKNKNNAEKLLKKSYDELEDKVEERTAELKSSNEHLVNEINNRIKIEKSLRESEERFRQLADSAPVLIWMSDKNKLCTYFNKGWLNFTGRTMEQELGNGWAEGVYPQDLNKCLDIYNTAFDKREEFEMEYRLRTASGDYRWILNRGIPRYEGNEFIGYIGSCLDIHGKKRTERYLRIQYSVSKSLAESKTTKEVFSRIIENICTELEWEMGLIWLLNGDKLRQGSIWTKDERKKTMYSAMYDTNYTFEKGIGIPGRVWKYNQSTWIPDIESDSNLPRQKGLLQLGMKSALAFPIVGNELIGVIECFNKTMLTPKEDLLHILETVGRQIGSFIERKRVEEQLKDSHDELENRVKERTIELASALNKLLSEMEQKEKIQNKLKLFGHAIKGIKECVYITDLNSNMLFVNSAFEEIYGYYEEELIGKKTPVLFSLDVPEDLRDEILAKSLRVGWKGELKNHRKDGTEISIYLSSSAVRNEEGKVEALVGICQDITESIEQKELLIKRNGLLKLLNDVAVVTNRSFNIQAAISYAINKMCEYTDWDVGHCFFAEDNILVSSKIWNGNLSSKFLGFKELTENSVFARGEGIPGRCFENNESYWVKMKDIDDITKYKRSAATKKAGLKTGVWAPIKKGNKVVGVLEFFNKEEKEQDNEVLDSINNIGVELGSLFERNEILHKVRESEESLRLLIENVKDYAIIRLDLDGYIVSWNKGAEAIKGYKAEEIIGKHLSVFYTEEEVKENIPAYNLSQAKKYGRFEITGWRIRKDGSRFWADIVYTTLHDEAGSLIGFVKVTRDATERKKAEELIIESEKELKEAQKIAKMGSWEWDVKTNKVKWSDEMYSIYEVSPDEFQPTYEGFLSKLHPDSFEEVKTKIEHAYSTKSPFDFYERILIPGGGSKVLRSKGGVKTDENGNVTKLVGICLDVTEVTEAEEVIKKSEKQLKDAQQIAKLGSWEVNMKANIITWSEEMYRIFDIDMHEEPKPYEYIRNFIHADDVEHVDKSVQQLESNPGEVQLDFRIITRDGRLKYLATDIRVEHDENSNPVRLYGSVQDITEIKLVEEELRKANAKLIEAQKELVHNEKLAALGRFSSGIAHEIRNPLANISALAQLLSKSKIEDEKMKKHLKYILINSDIANNIIKDLLHFASPEDLVFKTENMNTILENIINSVEPRCNENKILVSKRINIDVPEILIDKTRLENALLNFISNSIDAMPEGGNLTINARTDNINNEVIIDVIDNGEGIPQENLDKIFEPFFTTKETGTGLGLGLAYQTIKLHQGALNISSEPGKGTHVEIRIPIRKNINSEE